MRIIGHRGCAAEFPENTLAAVRGAAPHVDLIEIDVRRCQSGELVVFHDEHLDRLTESVGRVSETEFDELAELTVGDSDESIPTLAAVLDAVPAGVGLNIELKEHGLRSELLALADRFPSEVIVSSFDREALASFDGDDNPTALLCAESFETSISTALDLGCQYIHPQYELVDADSIRHAHDQGLAVNVWTVPTTAALTRLIEEGVDGAIVDSWRIVPDSF
ncbi:glycerophosphodiester phosphodiesterase [Halovenus halobia]|uniref:glycerophosphodiester phosphodiesterase n=1 Tax=Halovenus halobia TaxID=3396622 RepID=UPI003F558644